MIADLKVQSDIGSVEQPTILIVDDEEMIVDLMISEIEQLGYNYMTAGNGKEALEVLNEHGHVIDVVLIDRKMPTMDGLETRYAYPKSYA